MPKVSIIIPVYNKEKYVSATLDSILQQQFTDYEVIVVNDGSTDNSMNIVEKYKGNDSRIRRIDIPNGGVSNARNVGLELAKGQWIQFLDGDDLIDAKYLCNAVYLAERFDVDVLFTNFWLVDEDGNQIKNIFNKQQGVLEQEEICQNFVDYQYNNGFFGYISNKLFRKKLLEKSKAKFSVDIKLAEDLDFYAQLYPVVQKAYFAPINSFYYLQTDSNYLNNSTIDYFSQLNVHLNIKKWFVRSGQYQRYQVILDKKVSEYIYFVLFYTKENGQSIKYNINKIANNAEIMESIHPEYFKGFEKWILEAIYKKHYNLIIALLWGRGTVRSIYRRLRKNG